MKTDITILYVDDDKTLQKTFFRVMQKEKKFQIVTASTGIEALQLLQTTPTDVVFTDIKMPEMDGLTLLRKIREQYPEIFVVAITGYGSIEDAVHAMKLGAYDYLQKPFDFYLIKMLVEEILRHRQIIKASVVKPEDQRKQYRFENIIGQDRKMFKIYEMINAVAKTSASVLITGESGTGKELIAEAIHYRSNRRSKPFHRVNCAALTESIINSELFGHEKGAFTGADTQKIGLFEKANEGTLFLDEIGDIPLQTQVSLLRVLETGTFQRVGGIQTIRINTRILCATNQDLSGAIQDKRFREDLFYRINVVSIDVPPLRERNLDIPLLALYFMEKYSQENARNIKGISKSAIKILNQYHWPGNVRELGNVIKHALIFCKTNKIQPANLPDSIKQTFQTKKFRLTLTSPSLPLAEATLIQRVLNENHWNLKQTAMDLEIARGTLYSKIKKYRLKKIEPPTQS
ncbi:MAG: sigma-54-dependent Fis family transcriptional regulator [Deltaproteobacteria bacterium]|jgi:two-component system NtrC family response regulator/two-component system response regulator HydG|nr:sigma-54-dependent Fis family transcriptional regulator [Deltaproteobacteria bacterium]